MATSIDAPKTKTEKDLTFRNYQPKAAAAYAALRPEYSDELIQKMISIHTSTGGELGILVDVGCGPGTATRGLAPHFQHAFGVDPGESMIQAARSIPSTTASGESVRYEICSAENLDTSIPGLTSQKTTEIHGEGLVDMITAAVSAHWFDLPEFYASAAKILKPNGTILFLGTGSTYCDPHTTPNAAKAQEVMSHLELEILLPNETEGNRHSRELYRNLPLPWTAIKADKAASKSEEDGTGASDVAAIFDRDQFVRLEFNADGKVAPGEKFIRAGRGSFELLGKMIGTASMVTRWREAHQKELQDGKIEDCVQTMISRLRAVVNEGRPEDEPEINEIDCGSAVVLLGFKKKISEQR